MKRVVIIGGGYAGLMAATRLSRLENATVTLVDQNAAFVQRIRLHEVLAGSAVTELPYGPALSKRGITFKQAAVEGISPERQELELRNGGQRERLGYDSLLIALGSTIAADLPGVREHAIRLNDAQELRVQQRRMGELAARGGRVLVIGGGLTGIEAATELATRFAGLQVSLACSGGFAAGYNAKTKSYLRGVFARAGITIHEQTNVQSLSEKRAHLSDGSELPFDACIWSGGFRAPTLLREMGLAVDGMGRAFVTPELHVPSNPSMFIAGDSAAFGDASHTIKTGCASAMPMGVQAANNLLAQLEGKPMRAHDFAYTGQNISLGRKEGLVYKTDQVGRLVSPLLFGRAGAFVKASVIEWTWASVRYDRSYGIPIFGWPSGGAWWGQSELAS